MNVLRSTTLLSGVALLQLMVACSPKVTQFYPDRYFKEDRLYENHTIGFTIRFAEGWALQIQPADMTPAMRRLAAQLSRQGAELLFTALTFEETQAARCMAYNRNLDTRDFAERIRTMVVGSVRADLGLTTLMIDQLECVTWEYLAEGHHFIEYFFKVATYNIRLKFWCKESLFEDFRPIYDRIAAGIELRPR